MWSNSNNHAINLMKPMLIILLVVVLGLTACRSTAPTGEKPPRYAKSVQVAQFDATPRAVNPDFEVFTSETEVKRFYKAIAVLSRNAKPQDQGLMITAIIWRAKQLGADAAILLPPEGGGWSFNMFGRYGGGGEGEPIYRAKAIVYTNKE